VRWGIHIDIAPQWPWLALQSLALWPIWVWMSQHLLERADNALGLTLLGAAASLIWRQRHRLRPSPCLRWLAGAQASTVAAVLAHALGGSDWAKLFALMALVAALQAFLPLGQRLGTQAGRRAAAGPWRWLTKAFDNTFVNRVCHKAAFVVAMLVLLAWSLVRAL
ncbi:MAG: hypothetical protein RLZ81_1819, partial [Pseudomonadota bacterium]